MALAEEELPELEEGVELEGDTSAGEEEAVAEETDVGESKQAAGAKGKRSAKAKAKRNNLAKDATAGSKKDHKKKGQKYCPPCGKTHPIEMFSVGAGQCGPGRKAIQNLRAQAIAQNQQAWWEEVSADPVKLKKICAAYWVKCPEPKQGQKKAKFVIAIYIEELRQEQQLLVDGVFEMMDERHYTYWTGKPKNGCVPPDECAAKWRELYNAPHAITDSLGPCQRYKDRVAVKKADMVTFREASIKARIMQARQKDVKNPDEAAMLAMEAQINKGSLLQDSSATLSRTELAQSMMGAARADVQGAFSSEGIAARQLGDVQDLVSEDEAPETTEGTEDGQSCVVASSENASAPGSVGSKKGSKRKLEPWFDKDGQYGTAIKKHNEYMQNTTKTFKDVIKSAIDTSKEIRPAIQETVKNEKRLVDNRVWAIKLVLGKLRHEDAVEAVAEAVDAVSKAPPAVPQSAADGSTQGGGGAASGSSGSEALGGQPGSAILQSPEPGPERRITGKAFCFCF